MRQSSLGKARIGSRYRTVAVIGAQSSGKSKRWCFGKDIGTLLNMLFDTRFQILDAQKVGRAQTTKGVWLALAATKEGEPLLVFDLEGADSKERGEQRMVPIISNQIIVEIRADDIIVCIGHIRRPPDQPVDHCKT